MARLKKTTNKQTYRRVDRRPNKARLTKAVYLFVSLVFVGLLVLGVCWWFRGWDGKAPVNVVVSSADKFWVLAVRPEEKGLVEIEVPSNMIIPIGESRWQARSLWELSRLEKNPGKISAVGWKLLEVPVDFTIRLRQWKGDATPYSMSFDGMASLDGLPQKIKLLKFVRSLHEGQIAKINLAAAASARRVVDPSGAETIEIDAEQISTKIDQWFQISQFRREGVALAIGGKNRLNSAWLARTLEHVGLRVVVITDEEGEPALIIRDRKIKNTLTVKKLSEWLDLKPRLGDFSSRAEVLIIK